VAEEGGIGVIAAAMIGFREKDAAKNGPAANARALVREIRTARAKTSGVLGVNIMVALSDFAELVRTAIREKIDVIFSGAGLPLDLPSYLTEGAKTKLVPIVSSGRAASILCRKWISRYGYLPDGFVVEGPLAGGHLGFKADELDKPENRLETLVAEVIEAVKPHEERMGRRVPVIAAGGVYTGGDICRFLEMGASGVQMGTRFVTTHECDANIAFKEAFINAKKEDIVILKSPVGMPGRAVGNDFLREAERGERHPKSCPYHCLRSCAQTESPFCIAMALSNAQQGLLKNGFAFAGFNAWRTEKIVSVRELVGSLREEFDYACERAGEGLERAYARAGERFERVRERAQEGLERARERAQEGFDRARERAQESFDRACERAGEGLERASEKLAGLVTPPATNER
jgi:nitronate monooxygenase